MVKIYFCSLFNPPTRLLPLLSLLSRKGRRISHFLRLTRCLNLIPSSNMFHLDIFAFFILFANLSLASNIENPLQYRQDNNTSTTTTSPSASPNPLASFPSLSTSQSTITQTSESTNAMSSDTSITSLEGAAKTSSTISTTQPQSKLSVETESSTSKAGSSHTASSSTTPTGSVTQTIVTTIVSTSGSVTLSMTSTSSRVIAAALASTTSSGAPGLNGANGGSGSSGLSPRTKSVVGGVVGGVGGAILLGGLAIVFWRVWGKNRRSHSNELVDSQPEKSSSVSGQSPFVSQLFSTILVMESHWRIQRSTLDQYHNPGPVNTASNF